MKRSTIKEIKKETRRIQNLLNLKNVTVSFDSLNFLNVWALADKKRNTVTYDLSMMLHKHPHFVKSIVAHELSHLAVNVHGHGPEFQECLERVLKEKKNGNGQS